MIASQWANALGATVIGTVGSKDKAELARANGCHHTILYRDEDFVARVKDITKGALCDVVYDGVGKTTFPASLDCLRPLGMFVSFGSSSGPIDAFNINLLQAKGSLFATRPTLNNYAAKREDLLALPAETFDIIASGKVKIPVNQKYPLRDAEQAHRDLESRATTGASILLPMTRFRLAARAASMRAWRRHRGRGGATAAIGAARHRPDIGRPALGIAAMWLTATAAAFGQAPSGVPTTRKFWP